MSARCTPTVFVAGLPSVDTIAADAQGVYFATQGSLNERLVASASGLVTLASNVGVYSVAADTTNVYFTGPLLGMDRVAFVPKNGGSVVTMTTQPSASAIAVDDVNVYYTGVTPHDVIGYVPKSSTGGVVPTELVDAGALSNCLILAARGGNVYYVNLAQLYALPRTGGQPRNLQATSHQPDIDSVIAVNDTGIAWSGGKPGGAYAMHMAFVDHSFVELSDGGPSLAVGLDSEAAYALVGDPAGTGEGSIVKVPLDGSARSLVAAGLVRPTKMATAADAIYVVAQDPNNNSAVAILRIAK